MRRQRGSKGGRLLHSTENPKEYVAILEWDDVEKARKFIHSSELREAAGWAGIGIKQDLLEEVEEVSA